MVIIGLFYQLAFRVFKIIGGIFIVLIGFRRITFSKSIIKISMFYTENLALVGILSSFKINTTLFFLMALVAILILLFFEQFKKYYILLANSKYNVIVTQKNKQYKIKAFFDTGNSATSNDGIPIIFLDKKYFNESFEKYQYVMIETVLGNKEEKAYSVDKFEILFNKKKIEKKVMIIFSDIDRDCLLNCTLMI